MLNKLYKERYHMCIKLYKYVCNLGLLRMCVLLDTGSTISTVYLNL